MAAVRYPWMFRTAAVIHLAFGLIWIWRFGFTEYDPAHRPLGIALGVASILVGAFLLRPSKPAMAVSALCAAFIAIAAASAAPTMRGPVILFFAAVAIVAGLYAALAARALYEAPMPRDADRD
ncbi:MAG TPA: hypothetical protein VFL16_06105 [Steroidobacteraceae bacterium]|nr:hypothetical protein [Steroidobacteraceae bacterium]